MQSIAQQHGHPHVSVGDAGWEHCKFDPVLSDEPSAPSLEASLDSSACEVASLVLVPLLDPVLVAPLVEVAAEVDGSSVVSPALVDASAVVVLSPSSDSVPLVEEVSESHPNASKLP
jgi:hypothetical protein